jgi:hypothetical protein
MENKRKYQMIVDNLSSGRQFLHKQLPNAERNGNTKAVWGFQPPRLYYSCKPMFSQFQFCEASSLSKFCDPRLIARHTDPLERGPMLLAEAQ